jgi:glycosyltransferase involved in cell wall biosynthesis
MNKSLDNNANLDKVAVIVPAWNEERDIQLVLDALGPIEWLAHVVVVDDGSTDATFQVAQDCAIKYSGMSVMRLPENQGKGSAMLAGINELSSEIDTVVFLDADLIGLTEDHLRSLISPIRNHECEMSVAIFKKGYWRTDISQKFAPNLNGQRCLSQKFAKEAIIPLAKSGYGVEIGLTIYARKSKWRIQYVDWLGVTHIMKEHKLGKIEGYRVRLMMYQQILKVWIRELW